MKLLFINQYYWPDSAATAQMLTDLCEYLAFRGHEVHVLSSRGEYDDGSHLSKKAPKRETRSGVHIRRISATGLGKRSLKSQVVDFASFHLLVGLRTLLTGWRYDAIVTLTTPPLIGIYATPVKMLSRVKHICWVMDLHPDIEFNMFVLRRSFFPRMLDWLNTLHMRRADACVTLGRCMSGVLIQKGVAPAKVHEIPLWGHEAQERLIAHDENPLRTELNLTGKFVVGYSGNAGLIHTFDEICAAALALRNDRRFVFLFIGGGRRLMEVQAFGREHKLSNLLTRGYVPRERLHHSLALADVHLITLREGLGGLSVPSKLYGIMAAGRPAIFIGPSTSETARAIGATDCGRAIANGDEAGLVAALRELADDENLRRKLGGNARAAFTAEYSAPRGCGKWHAMLEELFAKKTP